MTEDEFLRSLGDQVEDIPSYMRAETPMEDGTGPKDSRSAALLKRPCTDNMRLTAIYYVDEELSRNVQNISLSTQIRSWCLRLFIEACMLALTRLLRHSTSPPANIIMAFVSSKQHDIQLARICGREDPEDEARQASRVLVEGNGVIILSMHDQGEIMKMINGRSFSFLNVWEHGSIGTPAPSLTLSSSLSESEMFPGRQFVLLKQLNLHQLRKSGSGPPGAERQPTSKDSDISSSQAGANSPPSHASCRFSVVATSIPLSDRFKRLLINLDFLINSVRLSPSTSLKLLRTISLIALFCPPILTAPTGSPSASNPDTITVEARDFFTSSLIGALRWSIPTAFSLILLVIIRRYSKRDPVYVFGFTSAIAAVASIMAAAGTATPEIRFAVNTLGCVLLLHYWAFQFPGTLAEKHIRWPAAIIAVGLGLDGFLCHYMAPNQRVDPALFVQLLLVSFWFH